MSVTLLKNSPPSPPFLFHHCSPGREMAMSLSMVFVCFAVSSLIHFSSQCILSIQRNHYMLSTLGLEISSAKEVVILSLSSSTFYQTQECKMHFSQAPCHFVARNIRYSWSQENVLISSQDLVRVNLNVIWTLYIFTYSRRRWKLPPHSFPFWSHITLTSDLCFVQISSFLVQV